MTLSKTTLVRIHLFFRTHQRRFFNFAFLGSLTIGCYFILAAHTGRGLLVSDLFPIFGTNSLDNRVETSAGLSEFYNKLNDFRSLDQKKVKVILLGSGDDLPSMGTYLRGRLQLAFGASGAGFLSKQELLQAQEENANTLTIQNGRTGDRSNPHFDQVTVYHRKNTKAKIVLSSPNQLDEKAPLWQDDFSSTFRLDNSTPRASLVLSGKSSFQTLGIEGVVLENKTKKGVLMHQMAIPAIGLKSLSEDTRFSRQLGSMFPDLVLLSIGHQEAADAKFDEKAFEKTLQRALDGIQRNCPGAAVVLITPLVEAEKLADYPNLAPVAELLRKAADKHGLSLWDAQKVVAETPENPEKLGETEGRLLYRALMFGMNEQFKRGA